MNNKKELIDYIKTFNKEPGKYTISELLEIGRAMQTLPVRERNWSWLHDYLGIYSFSPDAYRQKVYASWNYTDKNKEGDREGDKYREEYSSKYKEREWVNAYRRLIREESRIDNLKEEIRSVVEKLNTLPPIKSSFKVDNLNNTKEAVLLLSDWHIGQESDNFYNTYNLEIVEERINKLVDKVIYYCQTEKISHLHILNLGDMIEGIINTNARIEQRMDVVNQIMVASEFLAQFMNVLTSLNINIDYRSCTDNHSRVVPDKKQHIEKENLNLLIDWYLRERLKNTSVKFIDDNLDIGLGKFNLNNGKVIAFMHGHNDAKSSILQNVVGATHTWIDYVCLGHYHNPTTHTFQDMRVFINGSMCGTGSYALSRRLFTSPSQKLVVFNDDDVLDIDILLK